jgi:hypothetical protein
MKIAVSAILRCVVLVETGMRFSGAYYLHRQGDE